MWNLDLKTWKLVSLGTLALIASSIPGSEGTYFVNFYKPEHTNKVQKNTIAVLKTVVLVFLGVLILESFPPILSS